MKSLDKIIEPIKDAPLKAAVYLTEKYNKTYEKFPLLTNYASTAIGTVGGDIIAKKFIQGEEITPRDLAFTAGASLYQSFLHPQIIKYTDKIFENEKVLNACKKVGMGKKWAKTFGMTLMFAPANILYWGVLSAKNQVPFNKDVIKEGFKAMGKVAAPYMAVDYQIANNEKVKKYALPIWTGTELIVNTFYAVKNLLLKS
ncbi:MAG: hypothetical protein PF542_06065 [Nanoarchaeota archaeon]|jgi:hypothetical protein|nr:hypothetical protein [Nanoarchaeota archaeon]